MRSSQPDARTNLYSSPRRPAASRAQSRPGIPAWISAGLVQEAAQQARKPPDAREIRPSEKAGWRMGSQLCGANPIHRSASGRSLRQGRAGRIHAKIMPWSIGANRIVGGGSGRQSGSPWPDSRPVSSLQEELLVAASVEDSFRQGAFARCASDPARGLRRISPKDAPVVGCQERDWCRRHPRRLLNRKPPSAPDRAETSSSPVAASCSCDSGNCNRLLETRTNSGLAASPEIPPVAEGNPSTVRDASSKPSPRQGCRAEDHAASSGSPVPARRGRRIRRAISTRSSSRIPSANGRSQNTAAPPWLSGQHRRTLDWAGSLKDNGRVIPFLMWMCPDVDAS